MAGSHKETRRVDAGRNSNQPADTVGKTSSGQTKADLKKQDAEWGFDPGRSGMATEAKMGMSIIVILVGAFGFLVYHKFDLRQRQLLAEVKPTADSPDGAAADAAAAHASTFDEFQPDEFQPDEAQPGPFAKGTPEADAFSPSDVLTAQSPAPTFDDGSPLEPPITDAEPFEPLAFDTGTAAPLADATDPDPATEPASPFDNLLEPIEGADATTAEPAAETMVASNDPFPPFDSTQQTQEPVFAPFDDAPTVNSSVGDALPLAPLPLDSNNVITPQQESVPELVDQFEPVKPLPPVDTATSGTIATADIPAFPAGDRESQPDAAAPANPFDDTIKPQTPPDGPVEFMANVQPEILKPVDTPQSPQQPAIAESIVPLPADPFVNAAQTTVADAEPELLPVQQEPLFPLEPANTTAEPPAAGRLNPDTAIAMLDPAVDVNLFEDPIPRSKPPVTDPQSEFPSAAEPDAPDFPGFDDSPRTFEPAPATENFPVADGPAETIKPPEPNLFSEPIDNSTPADGAPAPAEQRVPIPRAPLSTDSERVFGAAPETAVRQYDPPPRYVDEDDTFDVNAPGVGVAHIVPGASRIQLTAATEECAICEVQPKDNYWTISRRAYGTARYFSSLAEYNRHRIPDPRKLRPGMKVLVPDPKILEAKYPEFFKDQKKLEQRRLPSGFFLQKDGSPAYRVGARETLGEISQKHLGRASRWIQIFRMNQQILQDPNKLKPGTVIRLPDDATNVQLRP